MALSMSRIMQGVSKFGGEFKESFAAHQFENMAEHEGVNAGEFGEDIGVGKNRNIMDRTAATYNDVMLGSGNSTMRRAIGYGVPGVAAVGLGVGAYDQGRDGNAGGAAVLGAGAAVLGGALALSHFGAVAEGGIERIAAEKMSNTGANGVAAEKMGTAAADTGAARTVIQPQVGRTNADYAAGRMAPLDVAAANASRIGGQVMDTVRSAVNTGINNLRTAPADLMSGVRDELNTARGPLLDPRASERDAYLASSNSGKATQTTL
jgi:hypothetical protein